MEEKIAELENIAYSLGAKQCSIEIVRMDAFNNSKSVNSQANLKKEQNNLASKSIEFDISSGEQKEYGGKKVVEFAGHNCPKVPKLKWFEFDDNVRNLITMRCTDVNSIKCSKLELSGAMSATMSVRTACAIDLLSKLSVSASMEQQANKEQNSRLVFEVKF